MKLEIGLECKECGDRLEAEIIPTMGKENILLIIEPCAECIQERVTYADHYRESE